MRKLLQFLIKRFPFLIFLLYAVISIVLLVRNNPYHQSVYFSSSNNFVGSIYSFSSNVFGYFGLREVNQTLLARTGQLEQQLQALREQLRANEYELIETKNQIYREKIKSKSQEKAVKPKPNVNIIQGALIMGETMPVPGADSLENKENEIWETQYEFIMAQVINNNISHYENYITLNKGERDGIKPLMGIIGHNGIVGIVTTVGPKYSVAISLLNTKLRLSAKIKESEYFGSLVWKGNDSRYAVLEELPLHVHFEIGDTIVTSGYSAAFPPGLMIGTVEDVADNKNDNFYALKIRLAAEFARLSDVQVIVNKEQEEQLEIEGKAKK